MDLYQYIKEALDVHFNFIYNQHNRIPKDILYSVNERYASSIVEDIKKQTDYVYLVQIPNRNWKISRIYDSKDEALNDWKNIFTDENEFSYFDDVGGEVETFFIFRQYTRHGNPIVGVKSYYRDVQHLQYLENVYGHDVWCFHRQHGLLSYEQTIHLTVHYINN